jgi:hypothetical protein
LDVEEVILENEMAYMKNHPPRCLGGYLQSAPDKLRTFLQTQLGEYSTVFSPVCVCRQEFLKITSSNDQSPTSIFCKKCGQTRVVFDYRKHGYDGELGHNVETKTISTMSVICSHCGWDTFRIAMCFQYSGETDVLDDEDPPDVKPEDLFGWIMIATQCEKCETVQELYQNECA